ncbi:hypothetical protein D7Z54_01785 [Salibacterium salarium]|uniref:Sublancin immunity protein SunI-like PH domain-containing protein n=1 Tax=Salibacterium salarium TaxID=284579 RepID=A0A3R9Q7I3_9BACI|nr:hypothetical protein [Salibacterium salarium]RSL35320.1 hypothetical protein D7Z54_01785 [Salibacterium salarium]
MMGIKVEKSEDNLIIKWQLSKTEIPISDITDVTLDDTYGGQDKEAIRIGTPYATTDRIAITTGSGSYILFTTNVDSLLKKINKYVNEAS